MRKLVQNENAEDTEESDVRIDRAQLEPENAGGPQIAQLTIRVSRKRSPAASAIVELRTSLRPSSPTNLTEWIQERT